MTAVPFSMPAKHLYLASPWRCATCRYATRPFSTTGKHRVIGPESPNFIDVPRPPQPDKPRFGRVRGSLPVPRDIFRPKKGGLERVTDRLLRETTPESKEEPIADPEATSASYRDWKQRMAVRRRQNFREGMKELLARRQRSEKINKTRARDHAAASRAAAEAPQREDEMLTNTTTTALMRTTLLQRGVLPDPNRQERLAAMRTRVQEKEERRSEERRSALNTLYMHARNFITTEEQLDEAIEKQFGTVERPATFRYRGTSIWSQKLPETLEQKLRDARGLRTANEGATHSTKMADKRLKRIAEELTGGKI